ncbi:hypothetical protein W97_07692 [Coniosporium apollinis CBS 100218]|uniref:Glycine zipper 2TM domain-containing protein n=1 Tax=Coniosporium apollinis (strain CBS 100218) TaxID=1168221 RepID=R7Z2U5_CONA1|nr:uncharacterized protein W97_07692 [Coniosporium apollinis CBS 100218]EON68482.1 hypothetical protein W97_07692 [Coniosporium apollinis CBS 100218]
MDDLVELGFEGIDKGVDKYYDRVYEHMPERPHLHGHHPNWNNDQKQYGYPNNYKNDDYPDEPPRGRVDQARNGVAGAVRDSGLGYDNPGDLYPDSRYHGGRARSSSNGYDRRGEGHRRGYDDENGYRSDHSRHSDERTRYPGRGGGGGHKARQHYDYPQPPPYRGPATYDPRDYTTNDRYAASADYARSSGVAPPPRITYPQPAYPNPPYEPPTSRNAYPAPYNHVSKSRYDLPDDPSAPEDYYDRDLDEYRNSSPPRSPSSVTESRRSKRPRSRSRNRKTALASTVVGALAGGLVGSEFARGSRLAAAAGAVIGGLGANELERRGYDKGKPNGSRREGGWKASSGWEDDSRYDDRRDRRRKSLY